MNIATLLDLPRRRPGACVGLLAAGLALAPDLASATIYFSAPGYLNGQAPDLQPPTKLLAVDEVGGGLSSVGDVKLGGVDVAISAIALDSRGALYGFVFDPQSGQSRLAIIDRVTAAATLVGAGTPFGPRINAAAFDRFDQLWVIDIATKKLHRFDIEALGLVGAGFPIAEGSVVAGADLAFDLDNTCYYLAVYNHNHPKNNDSTMLYTCDVDKGTFDPVGELTASGFFDNPPDRYSSSGLAFSISNDDCSEVLMGCDGYTIDEVGVIDIDALTIQQTADLKINQSWYMWPDMAGFPSVVNTPACDKCGDGQLDPGEECDDGNDVDEDGCTVACLKIFADGDGDGVLDVDDLCEGFDDASDGDSDGVPDGCDNCPGDSNPDQADGDEDGLGDACDLDDTTSGDATSGDATTGDATTGDATTGDATTGDVTTGDATTGDGSTGGTSTGSSTSAGESTTSGGTGDSASGTGGTGDSASGTSASASASAGGSATTDGTDGTGAATSSGGEGDGSDGGCGCRSDRAGGGLGGLLLLALPALARRRRRSPRR